MQEWQRCGCLANYVTQLLLPVQHSEFEYVSIVGAIKNLFFYWQKPEQTHSDYHEDFMALVKVIEEYGGPGSLSHFPNMITKEIEVLFPGVDISNATSDQMK